ncbi:putative pili assembly chaperone [Variovorax paradoxus B4]|uniref:Putative pili assembly chaperone n=1 Tax=Variovorax paradoxus B4 TaxID=1246301 RepID=T1XM32_VARPD|nr:fimbria/pilus periplasmic chaperone [Variovorax paradoxus]AGU53653.1 putative pili assembly chaperone [Variovorax paradoxus B4]
MAPLLPRIAALLPWVLAAMGIASGAVQAASLYVAPVRVVLTPSRPVAALTLGSGEEEAEVAVQAEVMAWSQENGQDIYQPTREVLVNPSIFRLSPGAQQIVRLGLQVPAADTERSYRIFFQQLPRDQALPRDGKGGAQLQTLLRLAVPIFVPPAGASRQDAQWRLQRASPDSATPGGSGHVLTIDNRGTDHLQLTQILVRREGGVELLRKNMSLYVLPGRSADVALDLPLLARGSSLQIDATSDAPTALPAAIVHIPRADTAPRQ